MTIKRKLLCANKSEYYQIPKAKNKDLSEYQMNSHSHTESHIFKCSAKWSPKAVTTL